MWHEIRSALLFCQFFVICDVPLPHFCPVLAANDLKFSFYTLALAGLLKVWIFASAIPLCLYYQRSEVPLSVLPLGHDFERSRSSSTLVLPVLPSMGKSTSEFHFCRDFKRCEVPLPHFCSALTANDMKSSFRTSALPGRLKVWSFASAIPLCLYCQRSEVPLSILPLGQDFEDLPHLFCQDFQIWISHFISAGTSKDLKFRFCTSALPWLPKMWSSAFSVPPYVLIMHSHTNLYCLGL